MRRVAVLNSVVERDNQQPPVVVSCDGRSVQAAQPFVQSRGCDRRDQLSVEVVSKAIESAFQVLQITNARAVCFLRGSQLLDQF